MAFSQIAKGAIISYISIGISIIISFLYTPWMIKQIGVSDYGLYNLALSLISYFIMDFGLSTAVQRFIAKYRAENDVNKISKILGLVLKAFLVIDLVIFLILFVLYFFIEKLYVGLSPDEISKFKTIYVIAGTFSVLTFLFKPSSGAMMAFEYFVDTKLLEMFHKVGMVVTIVVALLLGGGVEELIFITGAFGFLTSFLCYIVFRQKSKIRPDFLFWDKGTMKELLNFSGWIFIGNIAQRFRLSILPSVLGVLSTSAEISVLSLGMAIEGMVYMLSSALNGLFLPKVTSMLHSGERNNVEYLMVRVGRVQEYIIAFILFGFWCLGQSFIELWVGDGFRLSYYVVILLTLTNFVSLTQHIAGDMVYAENYVNYTGKFILISSLLGFLISVLTASKLGAVGCAIGFCVAETTSLVLSNVFVIKKKLSVNLVYFFKNCQFKILPAPFLLAVMVKLICFVFSINGWFEFITIGLCYVIAYVAIMYYYIMDDYEKQLVKNVYINFKISIKG